MKKVTIYDVAEEAGVSLATVSRVINGSNVVKSETRDRVLKTIKRLDFKPNQIARGLATSKTTTLAIIFPQSLFGHVKEMVGGIGDAGRVLDYNILFYTTDSLGRGDSIIEITEKVVKSRADGVVIFYNDDIEKELTSFMKYKIPTVVLGYCFTGENVCSIYLDAKKLGHDLTKTYLDKGLDDIIFVQPKANLIDLHQYIVGIKEAFLEAGKTFADERIIPTSTHYEKNLPQFQEYFKTHKHDVVLTGYDKTAVAVVNAALDNNIKVPEEMEIVGLMDTSYAIMSRPALTSVHVPVYEMGAMAVRLLTKILNDEEITDPAVSVVYRLIERQTTK